MCNDIRLRSNEIGRHGIVVRNGSSRVAMIDDSIDEVARQMTNAKDGSRVPESFIHAAKAKKWSCRFQRESKVGLM
jgi:hypothetical protein